MRYLKLFENQKPIPSYSNLKHQLNFRTTKGSNPFDRLYDKNHREVIDYEVYLPSKGFNLQRDFVWSLYQKQQFILSILKDNPIPSIAVVKHRDENDKVIYQIIDGKQRIKAYVDFCDGLYPIIINNHEYYYNELPQEMKNHINRFSFQGSVAYSYYNEPISDDDKIRWFEQLNFGGTPQDEEHINKLKKSL